MSIADRIVQDKYKVVYKEIFIQMMEQQKRFAITWILKSVYYFIGKREAGGTSADDYGPIG